MIWGWIIIFVKLEMPRFEGLTSVLYVCWLLESAASDYFQYDDLLKPEEQAIRKKVRECMEKEVAPIMTQACSFFVSSFLVIAFSYVFRKCPPIVNIGVNVEFG